MEQRTLMAISISACLLLLKCNMDVKTVESKSGIYAPGKTFNYVASFADSNAQVVLVDTLILRTENSTFLLAQNKIIWKLIHYVYPAPNQVSVETTEETTGLVDTDKELWIHPPRFKDYENYTELAPFPKVKFPLEEGMKWTDKFNLGTHASEERGSEVEFNYVVSNIDTITSNPLVREIVVEGTGKSKSGIAYSKIWFDESKGFNKMEYIAADKKQLNINLVK